jgi:hypothetical protein
MTPSGIEPTTFWLGPLMGFGKYGYECAVYNRTDHHTDSTHHPYSGLRLTIALLSS